MNIGMPEILLVLLVVVLLFGGTKLPQLGEGIGKAIKNLKRGLASEDDIDVTPKDKQVSDASSAKSAKSEIADAEVLKK